MAALFGLAGGLSVGAIRHDRRAVLGTLVVTVLIGVVTWLGARDSIAGPSLTVGGGVALAAVLLATRTR